MFNLKMSCNDCPFVEGSLTNISLAKGRIKGIQEYLLNDASFSCHKTINYENRNQATEQHYAGAMIWLYKQDRPNQMMRVAERLGLMNEEDLKCTKKIID